MYTFPGLPQFKDIIAMHDMHAYKRKNITSPSKLEQRKISCIPTRAGTIVS